jgi:YD repeat-containing protein
MFPISASPTTATLYVGQQATFTTTVSGLSAFTRSTAHWTVRYIWERKLPGQDVIDIVVRDVTIDTRNYDIKDYTARTNTTKDVFITSKSTAAKGGRRFRCKVIVTMYLPGKAPSVIDEGYTNDVTWLVYGSPEPTPAPPTSNTANYNKSCLWLSADGSPTTVGTNGGSSYYGTYDQNGNIEEWNDLDGRAGTDKCVRGGSCSSPQSKLQASSRSLEIPQNNYFGYGPGFRISTINNPLNLPNFVTVGDVGNAPDTAGGIYAGYGRVNYTYKIGKYQITNCEYADFCNAVATDIPDTYGIFDSRLFSNTGIVRSEITVGGITKYSYRSKPKQANKPACHITWYQAARYCNWLHNNRPIGPAGPLTTETGAYTLNGVRRDLTPARNPNATYYIPTENEWYKAAYYKGGGLNAGYWLYATQSNQLTTISSNSIGEGVARQTSYECVVPTPIPGVTPTATPVPQPTPTPTSTPVPPPPPLFDINSFSTVTRKDKNNVTIGTGVPAPFLVPLTNAARRWMKFLRMNSAVIAKIKTSLPSWNGIFLTNLIFDNLQGTELNNAIAACGISDSQPLGGIKRNSISIDLYINTHYQNDYNQKEWEDTFVHELAHGLGIGFFWDEYYTNTNTIIEDSYVKSGVWTWLNVRQLNAGEFYPSIASIYQSAGVTYPKYEKGVWTDNTSWGEKIFHYDEQGNFVEYTLKPVPLESTYSGHWSYYNSPIEILHPCKCRYPWHVGGCDGHPSNNLCDKTPTIPAIGNDIMVPFYDKSITQIVTPLTIKMLAAFGYEEITPGASEGKLTVTSRLPKTGYTIQNSDIAWTCSHLQKAVRKLPGKPPYTTPTPTATSVPPTATPVTPTATPVTPTATPVTPTATPVTPTATPVTPTATPVTPTATPVTPTATPVTPTATPVPPTATPVPPTATAIIVTSTPAITPSATPPDYSV